ncbi:MAG: thioesterase family protein [Neomegalonema sp.]|nr:thioesterase family protein [Neomegalonema sp.]
MTEQANGARKSGALRLNEPFPRTPVLCERAKVRPEWIDYNDHMNIGYYLIAIDLATDRFFEDWIGVGPDMATAHGKGSFVLQTHMHFLREMRLDDEFDAHIQLLDCDAKRWRYIATLTRVSDGAKAATAEQIAMCVDHSTRRSAPLPETQRRRLEQMMDAHRSLPVPPEVGAPLAIRRAPSDNGESKA